MADNTNEGATEVGVAAAVVDGPDAGLERAVAEACPAADKDAGAVGHAAGVDPAAQGSVAASQDAAGEQGAADR